MASVGAQRAEARVEVIVVLIDELQRNRPAADLAGQPVKGPGVAADDVAAEQRVAAEQGVAGSFEVPVVGKRGGLETGRLEPGVVDRGLDLPGRIAELGQERPCRAGPGRRWP